MNNNSQDRQYGASTGNNPENSFKKKSDVSFFEDRALKSPWSSPHDALYMMISVVSCTLIAIFFSIGSSRYYSRFAISLSDRSVSSQKYSGEVVGRLNDLFADPDMIYLFFKELLTLESFKTSFVKSGLSLAALTETQTNVDKEVRNPELARIVHFKESGYPSTYHIEFRLPFSGFENGGRAVVVKSLNKIVQLSNSRIDMKGAQKFHGDPGTASLAARDIALNAGPDNFFESATVKKILDTSVEIDRPRFNATAALMAILVDLRRRIAGVKSGVPWLIYQRTPKTTREPFDPRPLNTNESDKLFNIPPEMTSLENEILGQLGHLGNSAIESSIAESTINKVLEIRRNFIRESLRYRGAQVLMEEALKRHRYENATAASIFFDEQIRLPLFSEPEQTTEKIPEGILDDRKALPVRILMGILAGMGIGIALACLRRGPPSNWSIFRSALLNDRLTRFWTQTKCSAPLKDRTGVAPVKPDSWT